MWYLVLSATYLSICPVFNPRGAPANGGRTAVLRCLSRAALPDRAGQRVERRGAADCPPRWVQRTSRAHCSARFHYPGGSVSAARVLRPHTTRALGERGSPAAPGLGALVQVPVNKGWKIETGIAQQPETTPQYMPPHDRNSIPLQWGLVLRVPGPSATPAVCGHERWPPR